MVARLQVHRAVSRVAEWGESRARFSPTPEQVADRSGRVDGIPNRRPWMLMREHRRRIQRLVELEREDVQRIDLPGQPVVPLADVAREYGVTLANVRKAVRESVTLRGERLVWPGKEWTGTDRPQVRRRRPRAGSCRVYGENGQRWETVIDAAAALNVVPSAVREALRRGHRCGGVRVSYGPRHGGCGAKHAAIETAA